MGNDAMNPSFTVNQVPASGALSWPIVAIDDSACLVLDASMCQMTGLLADRTNSAWLIDLALWGKVAQVEAGSTVAGRFVTTDAATGHNLPDPAKYVADPHVMTFDSGVPAIVALLTVAADTSEYEVDKPRSDTDANDGMGTSPPVPSAR